MNRVAEDEDDAGEGGAIGMRRFFIPTLLRRLASLRHGVGQATDHGAGASPQAEAYQRR